MRFQGCTHGVRRALVSTSHPTVVAFKLQGFWHMLFGFCWPPKKAFLFCMVQINSKSFAGMLEYRFLFGDRFALKCT